MAHAGKIDFSGLKLVIRPPEPFNPESLAELRHPDTGNVCLSAVNLRNRLVTQAHNTDPTNNTTNCASAELSTLVLPSGSSGRIFFTQIRVGYQGVPILVYKIRTMNPATKIPTELLLESAASGPAGKMDRDPRVTFIGRLLRPFGLDEMPQIINLLKGEMKLVGHRPIPIEELDRCSPEFQTEYLRHKPGLMGIVYSRTVQGVREAREVTMEYFKEYDRHPFRTDFTRFFQICYAFLIKGRRSS